MPNHTPSQVKRAIRFALSSILDPELTKAERRRVAEFFGYSCAFCGIPLPPGSRAHMDHLVSVAVGGTNHISNRVLACPGCNGDQKLERDWREFLRCKTDSEELFREREDHILEWTEVNAPSRRRLSKAQEQLIRIERERVIDVFDAAVLTLRQARRVAANPGHQADG